MVVLEEKSEGEVRMEDWDMCRSAGAAVEVEAEDMCRRMGVVVGGQGVAAGWGRHEETWSM